MTDDNEPGPIDANGLLDPGRSNVQLIYALYLGGFVIGITPLIGVVMAYMNRGKAGGIYESHYTWAIRTFWIGVLFAFLSMILSFVLIGILTFTATAVWLIVRCIVGLQKIGRDEAIANPQSWIL